MMTGHPARSHRSSAGLSSSLSFAVEILGNILTWEAKGDPCVEC